MSLLAKKKDERFAFLYLMIPFLFKDNNEYKSLFQEVMT